jgi:hypothetical protein
MRSVITALLFATLPLLQAADEGFRARPAPDYAAKQKQHQFTVAVMPYHRETDAKDAFGKVKPFKHGVLPVLVVITNDSDDALSLEKLQVRFIEAGREGLEPIPADDLAYVKASSKPKERPAYIPRLPGLGKPKVKKGPLADEIIVQRAFNAPIVAPHSSASGFFFYLTGSDPDPVPGSQMYISGLRNLTSGEELFYFEIPLDR